jgi:hypothetical protein
MENRYKFLDVFKENNDGSLTPKRQIYINGITFGSGTNFQKGVAFGGIDFHLYKYWDIAGVEQNGVLSITGFFQQ